MTKTARKTIRPALLSILTASALTLSGCSMMELPFGPMGKEESTEGEDTSDENAAENTSDTAENEETSTEASSESSSSEYPGAPAGFSPANDGDKVKLGESVDIVLPGYETETPLFFEVTVDPAKEMTVDEVQANAGGGLTGQDYTGFKCFIATIKYLGAGENDAAKDSEIFTPPNFSPTGPQGRKANYISGDNETLCGIHESDRMPSSTKDAQEGKEYKRATITFSESTGGGLEATGVQMNFGKSDSSFPSGKVYFE
nr:Uncharacterised protein [Streptococcus thermophilus]